MLARVWSIGDARMVRTASGNLWLLGCGPGGDGRESGLPVPGDTLLLLGAASAGAGYLEVWGVIGAAAVGAMVGDSLGNTLGRWGGRPLLERYGRLLHLQPRHLARAEEFFARYGARTVFVGRFIAILRTYSALLAGLARLPYPSFLFWNAAGGCLWALTFGWLGATFGSQWPLVARWAGRVGVLIVGLLVLVGVAVLLGRYRRGARADRHRAGPPSRAKVLSSVSHGLALAAAPFISRLIPLMA